jgi:TonB family protein
MKNTLITLLASLFFLTGFCQDRKYEVHANEPRPLTKETISKAKTLGDLIPGYPDHWISSYVSVDISTSYDGKVRKAMSPTDVLTAEQKNILDAVELGTVIVVDVNYKYDNLSTNKTEKNDIHVVMTLVPETQAEYVGGHGEMNKYLKENISDKISAMDPKKFQGDGAVMFTVNEEGEIVNAKITTTSGDPKTDKLFVEAVKKMPKWKPAQNAKGVKVKQNFIFYLDGGGGC